MKSTAGRPSMGKRTRKGGAEYDAFSRYWRHFMSQRRGVIKTLARRRERRQAHQWDWTTGW